MRAPRCSRWTRRGPLPHNTPVRTLSSRRPGLSEEDRAAWAEFARRVAILPGRSKPVPEGAAQPPLAARPASAPPVPNARPHCSLTVGENPGGIDRASWHRLERGKMPAERRLDLHGRTAQAAFHALHAFLGAAQAEGVRCVEIITGRGSGPEGGVLRRELPHWINQPSLRRLVLAAAYPHAANQGAVRLLLRRPR